MAKTNYRIELQLIDMAWLPPLGVVALYRYNHYLDDILTKSTLENHVLEGVSYEDLDSFVEQVRYEWGDIEYTASYN